MSPSGFPAIEPLISGNFIPPSYRHRGNKMKKHTSLPVFILILSLTAAAASAFSRTSDDELIEKIKITQSDIPQGYIFGKIPGPAKAVFKNNPWSFDNNAVRKLTGRIYPGGDYSKISAIHMTILTRSDKPFSDDIVCYLMVFNRGKSSADEIKKLKEHIDFNGDRALLVTRDNLAIFMHVDDTDDFHYIRSLSEKIEQRLSSL